MQPFALDAVGGGTVPTVAQGPVAGGDPFSFVVFDDEGLGLRAGAGEVATFAAKEAKGRGLTRK